MLVEAALPPTRRNWVLVAPDGHRAVWIEQTPIAVPHAAHSLTRGAMGTALGFERIAARKRVHPRGARKVLAGPLAPEAGAGDGVLVEAPDPSCWRASMPASGIEWDIQWRQLSATSPPLAWGHVVWPDATWPIEAWEAHVRPGASEPVQQSPTCWVRVTQWCQPLDRRVALEMRLDPMPRPSERGGAGQLSLNLHWGDRVVHAGPVIPAAYEQRLGWFRWSITARLDMGRASSQLQVDVGADRDELMALYEQASSGGTVTRIVDALGQARLRLQEPGALPVELDSQCALWELITADRRHGAPYAD